MKEVLNILPERLRSRASILLQEENFTYAKNSYKENKSSYKWVYNCGLEFKRIEEYKIAEYFFDETLKREPRVLFAITGKGVCEYQMNNFYNALKLYHKGLSLLILHERTEYKRLTGEELPIRQTSIPVKGLLVYKDTIYVGEAWLSAFEQLGNDDLPKNDEEYANIVMPEALYSFGNYLRNKKFYEDAVVAFRLAIRLNPTNPAFQTNLGTALAEKGDFGLAIKELKKAIKIDPKDAIAYCGLGITNFQLGNKNKAIKDLLTAIELRNGNYPFAQERLEKIRQGVSLNHSIKMNRKVFISYASEDKESVMALADDLGKNGIEVWLDEWGILPGDSVIEKIDQAMKEYEFFMPVLSNAFLAKPFPLRELRAAIMKYASNNSKYIIPVLKEKCEIPMIISDIAYAKTYENYESELRKMVHSILK